MTNLTRLITIVFFSFFYLTSFFSKPNYILASSNTTHFLYNGDGIRVAKTEEGKTTLYVGDMEKDLSSGGTKKYYNFAGTRIALKESSNLLYLVADHLGSTRALTDVDGKNKGSINYYPYGNRRNTVGLVSTRQFTSHLNDDSTKLLFVRARYYNPESASFIQPDPEGEELNRFDYAYRNPIRYFDPTGKNPVDSIKKKIVQFMTYLAQRIPQDPPPITGGLQSGYTTIYFASGNEKYKELVTAFNIIQINSDDYVDFLDKSAKYIKTRYAFYPEYVSISGEIGELHKTLESTSDPYEKEKIKSQITSRTKALNAVFDEKTATQKGLIELMDIIETQKTAVCRDFALLSQYAYKKMGIKTSFQNMLFTENSGGVFQHAVLFTEHQGNRYVINPRYGTMLYDDFIGWISNLYKIDPKGIQFIEQDTNL